VGKNPRGKIDGDLVVYHKDLSLVGNATPEKVFSESRRNVSFDLPECAEEDAAGRLTTLKVRHDGVQCKCT